MPLLYYVQNASIALVIVAIMLLYVLGQGGRQQAQDSLFIYLLFSVMIIVLLELCIDIFSGTRFTGSHTVLTLSAFSFYLLNPLPGVFYFLYIDQLHNGWEKIPKKMGVLIFIPMMINAVFVCMSLFNGMIFTIDATNTYGRGEYFFLVSICGLVYVLGSQVHIVRAKRNSNHTFPRVMIYPYPVVIASILQVHFEGMEIIGVSMILTMLMIFLHIQNTHANKDYLTSLYNRSLGVQYLQYLFQHKQKGKRIGGILMDINDFKAINDTYGHDMGDKSLRVFAKILKESFSHNWLICRYGGDEFLVFCELGSRHELEEAVLELRKNLGFINIKNSLPFPLTVSIGFAIVEDSTTSTEAFIKSLDDGMYADKAKYRSMKQVSVASQTIS